MYSKQYGVIHLIYHWLFEIYQLLSIHGRIVRQTIVQLEARKLRTYDHAISNKLHLLRKGIFPYEY